MQLQITMAVVVELVDTPDCESGPCGFESRRSPHPVKCATPYYKYLYQGGKYGKSTTSEASLYLQDNQ